MSFLESGKDRFTWAAAVAQSSRRFDAGCDQCGSKLEQSEDGKISLTGKCLNCQSWITDGDDFDQEIYD